MNPIPETLPRPLALEVLGIARKDEKCRSYGPENIADEHVSSVAADVLYTAVHGDWQRRMNHETRDRLKTVWEIHRRPTDAPGDPLAESAQRAHDPFNPWTRHAEINDARYVVRIGGGDEFTNTVDPETGSGVVRIGGQR